MADTDKEKATVRERQAPEARVYAYIKDPIFGGTTRKFVQLNGFRNVQSTISMTTSGSASVTFPNFKGALMRYVDLENILSTEKPGQGKETTNTLSWFKFMYHLTYPKPDNRFAGLWNDVVLSRGEQHLVEYSGSVANSNFMDRSRSRGDVLESRRGDTIKAVSTDSLIYCLPFMNLFDPIFIDYKGQDGKWYAGFTGLVTRISENYARTADQSITLQCRDLTVLLDNVSLITGWNMMSTADANSSLYGFVYSSEGNITAKNKTALSDIFSSFDTVEKIILELVSRSQDMWRFESGGVGVNGEVGVRAFKFDTTTAYDYTGISNQRGSIQMVNEDLDKITPDYYYDNESTADEAYYLYSDKNKEAPGTKTASELGLLDKMGRKKIFIDPLIRAMDNKFIHKLLNRDFALFRDSLKSADQILNELVAKLFAYKYFDGNGNLIIELAKPNALPNLEKYGGRSSSTFVLHEVVTKDKKDVTYKYFKVPKNWTPKQVAENNGINKITVDKLISLNGGTTNKKVFGYNSKKVLFVQMDANVIVGEDLNDKNSATYDVKNNSVKASAVGTLTDTVRVPLAKDRALYEKYTTLLFHGKNYLLSPDDFISFAWALDESALTTVVATDSNFAYLEGVSNDVRNATTSMHGVAVADYDMLAKLGVRRFQTQSLYNVMWPDVDAGPRVLSHMSACILERINSLADSGSFAMNQRPELQLGRTFINPLRMKSYLITGLTNAWSSGSPHTTNITATYGHPLHKTLEVPWLAIFMEPKVFFKDGDNTNIFSWVTPLDANGSVVTGSNNVAQTLAPATGTTGTVGKS